MDPKLWELIEAGPDEDEVALIIRRVAGEPLPPEVRLVADFGEIATCRMPRGAIRAVREHASVQFMFLFPY